MRKSWGIFLYCIIVGVSLSAASAGNITQIVLTKDGQTDYKIVATPELGAVDAMAVDELRNFLKQSTGADFEVVHSNKSGIDSLKYRIFIGLSPVSAKILGDDILSGLNEQEHVVKSLGNDIFLYGKGEFGNLYAVYSFLENQVGCRWYTAYGDMKIPSYSSLEIPFFDYKRSFAFPSRGVMNWFYKNRPDSHLFFFRNFQNQLLIADPSVPGMKPRYHELPPFVHTSFSYMPTGETLHPGDNKALPWLAGKAYFKSNPEFFSMDENGKRVSNRQLCFSNRDMRKKLTENIEKYFDEFDGKGVVTIDANDRGGKFCYCESCSALEDKYKTPGGPMLDCLIEICNHLKAKYPKAYIKTMAYRKAQSEIPPEGITRLPENLIVVFAPINDNILAPFSHPSNAGTYENLKKWCAMSSNVWVWYYTNPYISDNSVPPPPVGNLERLVEDVKLIKAAGVAGTYYEHDSGVPLSANFSELQTWMLLKLFQDPDHDPALLIEEFTDYYYGDAALLMRKYISELESHRKELIAAGEFWIWNTQLHQYTYLIPENIIKWQQQFDQMEQLVANHDTQMFHVRLARMSLDVSTVANWSKIIAKYPEMTNSLDDIEKRLKATYQQMLKLRMPGRKADISEWLAQVKLEPKPLPDLFDNISQDLIFQVNPNFPNKLHQSLMVEDSDAAWGVATYEKNDQKPYGIGFYDYIAKKGGAKRDIDVSEIVPDEYRFYKLGKIKPTPNCAIWGGRWIITVKLGHLYSIDEPDAEYDAYVSLKFEGPAYSTVSKNKPNRVLCDRVVLIRKSTN